MPAARWSWRQTWRDLLFAHWAVDAASLAPLVPAPLQLEQHEGAAWIAVVPFRMTGVSLRGVPDVPGLSAFPELNLRIYVTHDGRPGVWFLSLDATNAAAVWAARRWFHLPYHRARMACVALGEDIDYRSERVAAKRVAARRGAASGGADAGAVERAASPASFVGSYGPTGPVFEATPGTLEHRLTERYCLYAQAPDGQLTITEVHHGPWPLQPAEARIEHNTMAAPFGIALEGPPALLHFARRIDVVVWSPRALTSPGDAP